MKILISGLLVLVALMQVSVVVAKEVDLPTDVAVFTKNATVQLDESILVPTPVQVRLPDYFSSQLGVALVQNSTTSELVSSEFVRTSTTTYTAIKVSGPSGVLPELTDGHNTTSAEFAVTDGQVTTTTLLIEMAEAVAANGLTFRLPEYGILPDKVNITAVDMNGEETVVVATKLVNNNTIYFPERIAAAWRVTFEHTQPLRLTELSVRQSEPRLTQNTELLFLAVPDATYTIYFNPEAYVTLPRVERPYFTASDRRIGASLVEIQNNQYFTPPDSDGDGVIDQIDNCPQVANQDQKDIDGSGVGDVCEDFDRDGVMNAIDNCPSAPNGAQKNIDADAFGDECDESDDRFTEQNPLIPWLGLLLAAAAIGFMFTQIRKRALEITVSADTKETDTTNL